MYKKLFSLAKPYRGLLSLAFLFMVLESACAASFPLFLKQVINEIFVSHDLKRLYLVAGIVIAIFLAKGLFYFGQAFLMAFVGQNVVNDLRIRLFAHIQTLSLSFYHRNPTGVLTSRITNDVTMLQNSVTEALTGLVMDVLKVIGFVGVIFYLNWELAIISIIVLPLGAGPIYFFGMIIRSLARKMQVSMGEITSVLTETLQGVRIVKAFNMEDYEIARMTRKARRLMRESIRLAAAQAANFSLMETMGGISVAAIVLFGGVRVIHGAYTPGEFVAFLSALIMLYEPVRRLSRINSFIQQGVSAAKRIYEILDEDSEIKDPPAPAGLGRDIERVAFERVTFGYGGEPVLNGIDLDVPAGQVVALVGSSGAGKTTLVDLIPRFYDVWEGRVAINGQDVRNLSMRELRDNIAIVSQHTILFDDTVARNIAYGEGEAGEERVRDAAVSAYAHEFIQAMPEGYQTMIGEQGVRLSGGQRQRLAIARAILKDAPILILDEATSSLDLESEQAVQKALANLMQGRTTFVIAHRLSTIRNADRIIVLGNGRIVEEGRHDELLARAGEYHRLYRMQFAPGV